jgi:hypothetical protein
VSATTPTAGMKTCPKCGMAVPAKAYVCAYCKKRLRTGPVALGCAAVFALFVVLAVVIGNAASTSGPPAAAGVSDPSTWKGSPTAISAVELARKKTENKDWLKTKAGKLWKKHHWSPELCEAIAGRKVQIGMLAEQVREAWGRPESINTTITGSTRHDQWVWGMYQYAYFDDGVLTSIQQSH